MIAESKPGLFAEDKSLGYLELNPDQKATFLKSMSMLVMANQLLSSALSKGESEALTLDLDTLKIVIGNIETNMATMTEITGVGSQSKEDIEHRSAQLRYANMRVHELEQKLGASVDADVIMQGVRSLKNKLENWWDVRGFGYIPEIQFEGYGVRVTLSCTLHGTRQYSMSKTPVSDKEHHKAWLESLTEQGYTLVSESSSGRDTSILDTPKAREILKSIISTDLPSSRISRIESITTRKGEFILRDISIYIGDYRDIEQLDPTPTVQTAPTELHF